MANLLALLWPPAVLVIASFAPGPDAQTELTAQLNSGPRRGAVPPTTTEASETGSMLRTSDSGDSRVFWTVPEPGKVKIRVEIPAAPAAAQ